MGSFKRQSGAEDQALYKANSDTDARKNITFCHLN